ncbi:hypothetical protein [Candidatus Protochlamydia phocaeensis]|uniref:hypothetical protein n=1 Tax=Candidatus Protochlamydia phocaeensis TaxID=1414722 RepID=UPI00083967C9|nr:hypothetical protein [Candidatus Protochlamydia phocaeensis]
MNAFKSRLIHVARIQEQNEQPAYLFLRQLDPYRYVWFKEEAAGQETETPVWGATTEEAILAARKAWRQAYFTPLHCGFRYTLPERDEHGINALFYQMAASYASMTGVYFEEELGSNCLVQNASIEARELWKALQLANRL